MKAIVCEMCGSNDLIKQDGVYICQNCGTKYSPEEAKKMFIEGAIKIDNAASAGNYLLLAENACDSKNYSDAENYSNKVIEVNSSEAKAWFIKGKSAGWQTSVKNMRTEETVNCFNKALDLNANEDFKNDIHKELKKILIATVNLSLDIYSGYPSFESSLDVLNTAKLSRLQYNDFCEKHSLDKGDFDEILMLQFVTCVITAYSVILKDYKGFDEHPTDFAFSEYISRVDGAVSILDYAITLGNNVIALSSAYKKKIEILTDKEASKSYMIGSGGTWITDKTLKDEVKKSIIDEIMETHKKWNSIDSSHKIPKRPSPSSGCYIATAVYGSYDCPEVWVLRRFRDNVLANTWYGRMFIRMYYATSPSFVKWFGCTEWFKKLWKPKLDKIVIRLKMKGFMDTPYNDKNGN